MHVTTDEIISKVNQTILEHLGCDADRISPGVTFEDLGADSLDMVELTMAFEDQFNIRIEDDEAAEIETIQQAYDLLSKKLA